MLWNFHRYDFPSPGLTDENPNTSQPFVTNKSDNRRGMLAPTAKDFANIPSRGVCIAQPIDGIGNLGLTVGQGYLSSDATTNLPSSWGKVSSGLGVNSDSVLGKINVSYTTDNKIDVKTGCAVERRGTVRNIKYDGSGRAITEPLLEARNLDYDDARWLQAWDYAGSVYYATIGSNICDSNLNLRARYQWAEQSFYSTLVSIAQAQALVGDACGSDEDGYAKLGQKKIAAAVGTNVPQKFVDVHSFPLGESVVKRASQTMDLTLTVSKDILGASVQGGHTREHFSRAIKTSPKTANLHLMVEDRDSCRQDIDAGIGVHFARNTSITDNYNELTESANTPEGQKYLAMAEQAFQKKLLPDLNVEALTEAFETTASPNPEAARVYSVVRKQEASTFLDLNMRMHVLPVRPGYITLWGCEQKTTSRREIQVTNESGRLQKIERLMDIVDCGIERLCKQSAVCRTSAAEEWLYAQDGMPKTLSGMQFRFRLEAQEPQTPEELNEVLTEYNELFITEQPLMATGPQAVKATRQISVDTHLSLADIARFKEAVFDVARVTAIAERTKIADASIEELREALKNSSTVEDDCKALRVFVATHGRYGVAFVHQLGGEEDAVVNVSADHEIISNANSYCARI
jgi:hypothetical protein